MSDECVGASLCVHVILPVLFLSPAHRALSMSSRGANPGISPRPRGIPYSPACVSVLSRSHQRHSSQDHVQEIKWKLKGCETWGWGRCPNSQAWRMPPQPLPRPRAPATHRAPREHAGTAVIELQGYYNKRTISVYTGEGERRVIAVAAPRVGSCLLTAFLNRRSSAALSISAPPRNPALDWPK